MNDNKKASNFLNAINKYVKQQKDEIEKEVEILKQKEIEQATQEGLKDAYNLIQKEEAKNKIEIMKSLALKEQESKKELFIMRKNMTDKIFNKAADKLNEYTNTKDYFDKLLQSAEKINEVFCGNDCIVYISKKDSDKIEKIKSVFLNTNIEILIDNKIELGGLRAFCKSKGIILDDTFDSKLNDQKEWFIENSDLKVM